MTVGCFEVQDAVSAACHQRVTVEGFAPPLAGALMVYRLVVVREIVVAGISCDTAGTSGDTDEAVEFHIRRISCTGSPGALDYSASPYRFVYTRLPVRAVSGISTCAETWPSG